MKVLVTGGRGLVGSELQKLMPDAYYLNSSICDLRDQLAVKTVFRTIKPDVVVHLAARVGGIQSNSTRQAEYFYDNVMMNTNVVHATYECGCQRVIGMLSTCAYPDFSSRYPLTEDMLHDGLPAKTNLTYGLSKRMLAIQLEAYNEQYGMKNSWIAPCNLYGHGDKYDEKTSHFVAALIRKIHEAKRNGTNKIQLFGTGKVRRQFIIASDVAKILYAVIKTGITESFNIAPDENPTIDEIARTALRACDAEHLQIEYTGNLDGQFRKDASNAKMKTLFPDFRFTSLEDGIRETYQAYKQSVK